MKYALFLGCTLPVRGQNYEMAAREVSKKLGLELVDIDDFSCCGFPVKSSNSAASLVIAARNLAVAAENKLPVRGHEGRAGVCGNGPEREEGEEKPVHEGYYQPGACAPYFLCREAGKHCYTILEHGMECRFEGMG